MKQRLLFSSIMLLIFTMIITAGCAKKSEDKNQITISLACSYSSTDVFIPILKKSITAFMKVNPDITIKKVWFTNDYQTQLMTMIAGGNSPDIFRIGPDLVPTYISRDILMPLDGFIEKSAVLKLDEFFPQVLHKYQFDGKTIGQGSIYGFGTDWSPDDTLFFNKDLFDKAGIKYPDKSLSWEEFRNIAKKLTQRNGRQKQFGCLASATELFVFQNGGKVFSEDGKRCLLDSPEAVEALQFAIDLRVRDKVVPSSSEAQDTDWLQLFQTEKVAMFFSGRWCVPIISNARVNFRWGVAPALHQKKRVNMVTGPYGWVMSNKVKHPEAAWKLMEWLVAGDCEKELAKAGYGIPVIKKIAYSDLFLTNPNHPEGFNKIFLDEVAYTIPSPLTVYVPTEQWQGILSNELEKAFLGKQTAKQAAVNTTEKINKLIAENLKRKNG